MPGAAEQGDATGDTSGGQAAVSFAGYTVLCSASDGSLRAGRHGLFHRDTRVLSRHHLTIGGAAPALVASAQPECDRWHAILHMPRPGGHADGPQLPQDALEVAIRRTVDAGFTEELIVRNHSAVPCSTTIRLELDADFADVGEVAGDREHEGRIERATERDALLLRYDAAHEGRQSRRGLRVEIAAATSPVTVAATGLRFAARLEPRGEWRATIRYRPLDAAGNPIRAPVAVDARGRQRLAWRRRRPQLVCADRLSRPFERAADDLFELRNGELEARLAGGPRSGHWVLNAGIPMFTGLFGRDSLTAGWQSALLGPRAALGALDAVAGTQATADDPWRDAEPGKLIHELRSGPLAELGITPRDAYYGSQTTPAMFVLTLSEVWHWTGDIEVLRRHRDVALAALDWAERFGDLDGDGFLEYQRRSPRGLRNQGWKDSDEAIRHPDGRIVDGPIATVEEQAFHYLALERMAAILVALEDDGAERLLARADALRRRWHDAYAMDDGFYALALDGAKAQVRSITSNPGHALGAGIVPRDRARAVADRLLAPDLFSGWGVRSLSSDHPSYNPFAYHLGAVWPVEQATFALGFKRYGLDEHVDRLLEGVLAAAAADAAGRLPEALSGHARDELASPAPYPAANSPQAWSASAVIQLVQIMLGIYPFAPLRVLAILRPHLPAGIEQLTLRRLRVGDASVDLHFERRSDGSADWSVRRRRGSLLVVGAGPPDDVEPGGWWEQLSAGVLRRMPGRLVRAGRIALGWR